ncbi:ShlB/FhaC/HecB family hemolysin secretion/activation protein [Methylobacillus gramineus]|uniref:ShlB/FhaC/HecB family hemolysin secretion/activation protein n=1 Tax=Methylobacillus gramineus TaxID=755169 RepID=UPI001CFFD4CC|nr:ShlB/FhaC/HecB family hemolysin secretion/activation protein [Methylobacillus gramineus]MCB5183821.1 ShlB/FhaC/HecB family hemolysin secretion/activation protein [Methylobacillus gramineus]
MFLFRWVWLCIGLCCLTSQVYAAIEPIDASSQELLRQQERERVLRQQQEITPDVRQPATTASPTLVYAENELPCFVIHSISLAGNEAARFQFALKEVLSGPHRAIDRCLGTQGINTVMAHVQNVIVTQGYVTSRVLAGQQDLNSGHLTLTVIPGRVRQIRFTPDSSTRIRAGNALPISNGDILNLRDIEQGLENLKRSPTSDADIQIEPADGNAQPGESDLVIRYRQTLPLRLTISADDGGFDSTGKYQGGVTLSGDNLLGLSDLFYINHNQDLGGGDSGNRGSRGKTLHYSIPYGYWLFSATGSSYNYHQQVAGLNQSYLYSGRTQNVEFKVSRMVYRSATNKTLLALGSFFRKSFNYVDDTEVEVQRRRTAGWTLGLNQSWYIGQSVLDYTLSYRRGTGAHQALQAPEEAFGEGTSRMEVITADISFMLPLSVNAPWGKQALRYSANIRAQSNLTPLTPQDRFAIGSRYTVRGFDGQLSLSADRGWFIRNDLSAMLGQSGQALYLGLDYGEVGGQSSDLLIGKQLAGAVLGFRGGFNGFSYDLFLGQPIKKPNGFETAKTVAGFNLNWSF